ncbi:hypothetical protein J2X34_004492 [Rhodococcus sp. BE178]
MSESTISFSVPATADLWALAFNRPIPKSRLIDPGTYRCRICRYIQERP